MSLENGEIGKLENQLGLTPLEVIVAIETLLDEPSFKGEFMDGDIESSCMNCGYIGVPFYEKYKRDENKQKNFPVCPICGDKSWFTVVGVIAKIRKVLNHCGNQVFEDEYFIDEDAIESVLEDL